MQPFESNINKMNKKNIIVSKKNIDSSKMDIFIDTVYNNFIELVNVSQLQHNKQAIRDIFKCGTTQIYLILVNKKITSYIVGKIMTLNDGRKVLYISYLYTSPKFRKHGFASDLLKMADIVCKKNMLDGILLTCDSENIGVYNFYLKKGFMPDLLLRTYGKYEVMYKG